MRKTSFINREICFRLVHNKYVQVQLENPRREEEDLEADRLTAILEKMLQPVEVKLRDFHRELGLQRRTGVASCFQPGHKY